MEENAKREAQLSWDCRSEGLRLAGCARRVRLGVMSMAEDQAHTAPTLFLLMAQYNGRTVVPLDQVCRDFFGHLTVEKLLRKALRGDIALPIVRIKTSQKAQRGVHLVDLAAYIDTRRAAAMKECRQLTG